MVVYGSAPCGGSAVSYSVRVVILFLFYYLFYREKKRKRMFMHLILFQIIEKRGITMQNIKKCCRSNSVVSVMYRNRKACAKHCSAGLWHCRFGVYRKNVLGFVYGTIFLSNFCLEKERQIQLFELSGLT